VDRRLAFVVVVSVAAVGGAAAWRLSAAPARSQASAAAAQGLLTVLVRDGGGVPLASTTVHVEGLLAGAAPVSTSDDGRFTWPVEDRARPLDLTVTAVVADGATSSTVRGAARGVVPAAGEVVVVVRPLPTDRSLVVVVAAPDGSPSRGATVVLGTAVGALRTASTDDLGRARFERLTPQTWSGSVDPPPARGEGDGGAASSSWIPQRIEPRVPDGSEVAVRFRAGLAVEGSVVDEEGRPVLAQVQAMADATTPAPGLAAAVPGKPGAFRLLVDPDLARPVTIRAVRGRSEGRATVATLPAAGVTIRLAPPPAR
jgi:hypothetical protein